MKNFYERISFVMVLCCFFSMHSIRTELITDCTQEHVDQVVRIAIQQPLFLYGEFPAQAKQSMQVQEHIEKLQALFNQPLTNAKVFLDDQENVRACIVYGLIEEPSLEGICDAVSQQYNCTQEELVQLCKQILAEQPQIKRLRNQADQFIVVQCLIVDEVVRQQGIGSQLIKNALQDAAAQWPHAKKVVAMTMNNNNDAASIFLQRHGFVDVTQQVCDLEHVSNLITFWQKQL